MSEAIRKTPRKRKRRLRFQIVLCIGVLLGLLPASPVQAITMTFGDIEITSEPAPKGTSSHGYFEYLFHVVNRSSERSYTVSLSIPFERSFGPGDAIGELRRTVQIGANDSVLVSLLQPDHPPIGGSDVVVTIDGHRQDRRIQLKPNESLRRYHYRGSYASPTGMVEPLILISAGVKPLPTMEPVLGSEPMGMGAGSAMPPGIVPPEGAGPPGVRVPQGKGGMPSAKKGKIGMQRGRAGLPSRGFQFVYAETWSINWLAYTRYDGIIITAAELNALPAGIQAALWQYVETGGALLVLGRTDLRGLSTLRETKEGPAGWKKVQAGFGVCLLTPDANYDHWKDEHYAELMNDWRSTAASWSSDQRNTLSANQDFPVVEDLGIPVKGLFLLIFLFTLGIGPINILVLTRMKRRIWLLWTTPLLSLFTCLAVFGYMLISEGWSGRLRSETLTLLDETTHRATTIGWTGVYSPLTPSDGLHFSQETEVAPQRYFEDRSAGSRSCTINWTQDQHFISGWVEARVPAHFKVCKSELRRERVSLRREQDGRWSMVNGLGVAIRRFWYADARGQIHSANEVGPGARVMLEITEKESPAQVPALKEVFTAPSWMARIKEFAANPHHHLRPGMYLAEVDDSPFLEVALPSARTRKLHALVVGFGDIGPRAEAGGEEKR